MKIQTISKHLSILFASLVATSAFAASQTDMKATAKIEKFCSISANDVDFGVLNSPLTSQNANSEMKILCSNTVKYTINLQYGGIYGEGLTGNGKNYTASEYGNSNGIRSYNIYEQGTNVAWMRCRDDNQVFFGGFLWLANLYGATNQNQYIPDNYGACNGNGQINNQKLSTLGGSAYAYGVINGAVKGDKIAYYFGLPNDHSKVWNNGNNQHSGIGTGSAEIIELKATIIPDKSSSKYPSADTYLDTIIATVAY